jgi:hypothetical protein
VPLRPNLVIDFGLNQAFGQDEQNIEG